MVLYINNFKKGQDDEFVLDFIPKIIGERIKTTYSLKDTSRMNEYLKSMYGINTKTIVDEISNNIKTHWYGDNCQIGINTNVYEPISNQRLESLVKLVDIGNTDVKGLGLFRDSLAFIKHYIGEAYKLYLYKRNGGR